MEDTQKVGAGLEKRWSISSYCMMRLRVEVTDGGRYPAKKAMVEKTVEDIQSVGAGLESSGAYHQIMMNI